MREKPSSCCVKGGIRERNFQVKHSPIWLYPTYEHQKPHLLKPKYAERVKPVESGWHPETVKIAGCAEITETLSVDSKEQLAALQPDQIWNEQMISDRLKWKPKQPLIVLFLRVYRLPQPQTIPFSDTYGGCKSWLDLEQHLSTQQLHSVLTADQYGDKVTAIKQAIRRSVTN